MGSINIFFLTSFCMLCSLLETNYVKDQTSPRRYKPESPIFQKTVELEVKGQGAVAFEIFPSRTQENFKIFFRNNTNKIFEFEVSNRNVRLLGQSSSLLSLQKTKNAFSNMVSFDASSSWIWVSLCPYHIQLCVGQGYMMAFNRRFTFGSNADGAEVKKAIQSVFRDVAFIEIEGAELASPPKRWKYPVKTNPASRVTPKITLSELHAATHLTPLQLPFKAQALYGAVSGISMTPDEIDMINYSLDSEGATLNRKLKEKSKTFTTAVSNMSYIRVTVGDTEGVAPGLPFVLEIWPKGHFSPIHNHGDTVAVIKVLHGSIVCRWFNPLANRSVEKPELIGTAVYNKGDITWLNPEIYQTHQLENVDINTAAITIQAYNYMGHDTTHYETFDYVVGDKQDLQHFTPISDFVYDELIVAVQRDCGERQCLTRKIKVSSTTSAKEANLSTVAPLLTFTREFAELFHSDVNFISIDKIVAEVMPNSTTLTTVTSVRRTDCSSWHRNSCQTSSDCCEWNTPDFKFIQSCGDDKYCYCVSPGKKCSGGYRCCDGSICNSRCPPAAKFHYCNTNLNGHNCQSGLTCTVDSVSLRIFPGHTQYVGRCL